MSFNDIPRIRRFFKLDRIIRLSLGLLTVIFIVLFRGFLPDHGEEKTYLSSLSSTYSYSCTITTDSALSNVTLFLPVPADPYGNSPIVAQFSAQEIAVLPDDWTVILYDTGKATMVRITTPLIIPPAETDQGKPYSITLSSETKTETLIDTRDPINNSAFFHPVMGIGQVSCPSDISPVPGTPRCYRYTTLLCRLPLRPGYR
jgi:hypothetical protein